METEHSSQVKIPHAEKSQGTILPLSLLKARVALAKRLRGEAFAHLHCEVGVQGSELMMKHVKLEVG